CTADGACYPNPCGCAAAEVAIDAATGETRETCIDEAGASDASCQGLAACVRVTAPEPDCVVCAWIGGRVFYSTCQPDDGIVCEIVDRWRSGVSIGGAEPPDPDASGDRAASYDPCAAGGTFRTDDGCNTCH